MWPDDRDRQVSHVTIYTAIYARPKDKLRRELIACLRQGRSKRQRRSRGEDRRGHLLDAISIHVRPPEVDDRLMPGHWEGDLIKGAGNRSAVVVLVERQSRLVLLATMPDATAASALGAFSTKLRSIAAPMRKTFTYDQGTEMALHATLAEQSGVNVYLCDPHSPWQRGTCENTNGLLRQYLPKGTDLSVHSQADLDAIADSLNGRSRATHNFRSPIEVFAEMMKKLETPIPLSIKSICCTSDLRPTGILESIDSSIAEFRGLAAQLPSRQPKQAPADDHQFRSSVTRSSVRCR